MREYLVLMVKLDLISWHRKAESRGAYFSIRLLVLKVMFGCRLGKMRIRGLDLRILGNFFIGIAREDSRHVLLRKRYGNYSWGA